MERKKSPSLLLLQIGWVSGALALIAQSVIIVWISPLDEMVFRLDAWIKMLPQCAQVIIVMGAAAFGGPLISDQIRSRTSRYSPSQ